MNTRLNCISHTDHSSSLLEVPVPHDGRNFCQQYLVQTAVRNNEIQKTGNGNIAVISLSALPTVVLGTLLYKYGLKRNLE